MFSKVGDSQITKVMTVKNGNIQDTRKICTKCGKLVCECQKKAGKERVDGHKR